MRRCRNKKDIQEPGNAAPTVLAAGAQRARLHIAIFPCPTEDRQSQENTLHEIYQACKQFLTLPRVLCLYKADAEVELQRVITELAGCPDEDITSNSVQMGRSNDCLPSQLKLNDQYPPFR